MESGLPRVAEKQTRRRELVPLSDLLKAHHPSNPKSHDVGEIVSAITEAGVFTRPVVINERDGHLLLGHGSTTALTWMKRDGHSPPDGVEVREDDGEWLVPTERGISVSKRRAAKIRVADNRTSEIGGWDEVVLARVLQDIAGKRPAHNLRGTGFDADDLDHLLKELDPGQGSGLDQDPVSDDRADALLAKWEVETGDRWLISSRHREGDHVLIVGDALEIEWDTGLALFTDPPYGIDYDPSWLSGLGYAPGRLSSSDQQPGDDQSLDLSFLEAFERRMIWGFPYIMDPGAAGWIVWDKQPGIDSRGIVTPVEIASTTMRRGFDIVRVMWVGYYRAEGEERHPHPTQKPIGVWRPFIQEWTKRGDTIADPFVGSGSTFEAAETLGRLCIGSEIEPRWAAVTLERMALIGLDPRRAE